MEVVEYSGSVGVCNYCKYLWGFVGSVNSCEVLLNNLALLIGIGYF